MVLKLNINKNTFVMNIRFFVFIIVSFIFTGYVLASSSTTVEDKKPVKASSVTVKCNIENIKKDVKNKKIYISDNMLYIKTPLINDLIYVYTASGLCIDKFVKETELVVKDASAYPAGVLIITNGKDLTTKVVK